MTKQGPIVIVGNGRSGSTVFFEALAHHSDLGWITNYDSKFPESKLVFLHHYLRRSRLLDSCLITKKPQNKFKRSLADKLLVRPEEAYNKWNVLCDVNFSRDTLHGTTATENCKKNVRDFFSSVLHRQGKKRLVIKITGPTRMDFLSSIFDDACFIHVKRDPRAVVSSTLKTDYWQQTMLTPRWNNLLVHGWEETWKNFDQSPVALMAMQYQAISDNSVIESRRLKPGRYLEVNYSEFVYNPVATLEGVLDYVGLEQSPEVAKYAGEPGQYKDMDWKYKSELSPEAISTIEEITSL